MLASETRWSATRYRSAGDSPTDERHGRAAMSPRLVPGEVASRVTMLRTRAPMRALSHAPVTPSSTENSTSTSSGGGDIGADTRPRGIQLRPRLARRRVRNARVVDAREQGDERLFDAGQVAQGEIAVVELAFLEALADDAIDQLLDRLAGVVASGAGGRFGAVGEHEDGCFTGLWPRARVREQRRVDRIRHSFRGLLIEEADGSCAVVLRNHLDDAHRQAVLLGQLHTIRDVGPDHLRGRLRIECVVDIGDR